MTVATPSKNKSTMKPSYVSEHIREQFLASHMKPFIHMPLTTENTSSRNSRIYSREELQTMEPHKDRDILGYDFSMFCQEHMPDYEQKVKQMRYPSIEIWIELHRLGFRAKNEHLREYKNIFKGSRGRRNGIRYYGISSIITREIHFNFFILLLLEQGYDFSHFMETVNTISFSDMKTPIHFTHSGQSMASPQYYLKLEGIDITTKQVQPVIEIIGYASYAQEFLLSGENIYFTYGSKTPSLVAIDRDAPAYLFNEGENGSPVPSQNPRALFYNTAIFIGDDDQPTYGGVETWFQLTEEGLQYDYMLRTYHHLFISDETVYYYHTRTGMLKESNEPKEYAPQHDYGSVREFAKHNDSMLIHARGIGSFNTLVTPLFMEHPSFKYSGITTVVKSFPEEIDKEHLLPVFTMNALSPNVKKELNTWMSHVFQFFLNEKSPLFHSDTALYIDSKNDGMIPKKAQSSIARKLSIPENPFSNAHQNNFGYNTFFNYYAQNPAIEQVLKDQFLHAYAKEMISRQEPLPNPRASTSYEAVGLNRNVIRTIFELHRIREEKLPQIMQRYREAGQRNQVLRPNYGQRNRMHQNAGYNYSVSNALEERLHMPNFIKVLMDYFTHTEGPGQAFIDAYAEYLDYVNEVLPSNLPSLSSILSSCSMEFFINDERHIINIRMSQYLNYMRHAVQYQGLDFHTFHTQFRDYLSMKVQLHAHTDFEYYPKPSIRLAHDLALRDYNLIKHEHDRKNFEFQVKRYARLYTFEPDNEDYVVIAPETPEDVIEEGRNLRHCVGSYVSRISDGRAYVMFLRKKDEPEESYITIQINDDNQIVQVEGSGRNRHTQNGAVQSFLGKYRAYLSSLRVRPSTIITR